MCAIGVTFRSPQMKTLMIFVFISASLWGCLDCEFVHRTNSDTVFSHHFNMARDMYELVTNITQTEALTWLLNAVSATCWGSLSGLWWATARMRSYFFRNHSQITSKRATDDSCVHKCFSLGLSWLWHVHPFYEYNKRKCFEVEVWF